MDWPAFLSTSVRFDLWTILVAIVTNSACAILGCYLVLRRMSLLGDAISHAVLAGVAAAYLLTGQLGVVPVLVGAIAVGVLTAALTQTLSTWGGVPEDSSMGVVFTSLFALGVILISGVSVHLDQECVLFGKLGLVAVHTTKIGGVRVPHALVSLVPVLLLSVAFVVLCWKELKVSSFDAPLATAMGLSAGLVYYVLMGLVAVTTVASLEAVGAIVVVAMLIVPAATAHLLTDRLSRMLLLAVGVGVISAVAGWYAARWFDTNGAGMMAVVAGAQFAAAVLFAPQHGLVGRWLANLRLGLRIACEDVVAALFRREELVPTEPAAALTLRECVQTAGGGPLARAVVPLLRRRGYLRLDDGVVVLTERGRRLGRSLVRSHRLWEAYLDKHFELPADHLHEPAERLEHYIGPELQHQLDRVLHSPDRDPHGREIPADADDAGKP